MLDTSKISTEELVTVRRILGKVETPWYYVNDVVDDIDEEIAEREYPKRIKRDHLLRLADLLEGKGDYADRGPVPSYAFDLEVWVRDPYKMEEGVPHNCKTVACAAGYAGLDGWFRSRGLRTVKSSGELRYKIYEGLDAAEEFFGLSEKHAECLFTSYGYRYRVGDELSACMYGREVTPIMVAKSIRSFVTKVDKGTLRKDSDHLYVKRRR